MKKNLDEQLKLQQELVTKEQRKLNDLIHQKEQKVLKPLAKKYLGKCYKYRNSYGEGYEKWWLYLKVIQVKGTTLICSKFQKTSLNKIEIDLEEKKFIWNNGDLFGGYIEITEQEFKNEYDKFYRDIKNFRKMK